MLCLSKSEENIKYTRLIEMLNVLKLTKYKMSEAFFWLWETGALQILEGSHKQLSGISKSSNVIKICF